MKYKLVKKVYLDLTLDGSEAVMFNQGGKHKISVRGLANLLGCGDDDIEDAELEVSIQLERNAQGYFDHVFNSAKQFQEKNNAG